MSPEPYRIRIVSLPMLYAFPILIALMLSYMFWHAGVTMRRDRILTGRLSKKIRRSGADGRGAASRLDRAG